MRRQSAQWTRNGFWQCIVCIDRNRLFATVIFILGALLAGCQGSQPVTKAPGGPGPVYTLGSGDQIRVTVFRREDLSGEFTVDSTGRIALPMIRGVMATGLTVPELEDAISGRLQGEKIVDPKVSVDLVKSRPVCVLGEVTRPGCFDYVYRMRAASAIAMAGGYTYRARKDVVEITREDGAKLKMEHDALVYPGDLIEVRERIF